MIYGPKSGKILWRGKAKNVFSRPVYTILFVLHKNYETQLNAVKQHSTDFRLVFAVLTLLEDRTCN